MKRVRKYTYLPKEEIEVIETKSGETIKSKEILDGNYVKSKSAAKKVVKSKYAKGGKVGVKEYKIYPMKPTGVKGMITNDYDNMETFVGTEDEAITKAKEIANSNPNFVRVEVKLRLKTKTNTVGIVDGQNKQYAKGGKTPIVRTQFEEEEFEYADGGRIKVGTFNEEQLINKEDKKAVEKAKEESGLKYVETKIIKKGGKMYMEVYLIPNEEYYNSSKFSDGGMMAKGGITKYTTNEMMDIIYKDLGIVEMKKYTSEDGYIDIDELAKKAGFRRSYIIGKNDYWRKDITDDFAEGGIPSQIPSRIVRNAAKAAKEHNEDVKIYYSNKDKEFHYSIVRAIRYNDVLVGVVSPSGEVKNDDNFFYNQEDYNNYISRRDEVLEQTNKMADGGNVTDKEVADSNVQMLKSNIKSIKHHAEELEHAIKDNSEVEGWVLAKADRAATAMSDITHYLDGRKMAGGGMVAGYYYKDKGGSELRFVGPDSKDENKGIFKDGDKYFNKSYDDFEEEKENKSFWFGNGGYMPKGKSRKLSVSEKAEEMVGRNTWNTLDAVEKEGVIGELIADGALAITMDTGGIIDANDWNSSSTDEKIYALKKAGYSFNMASEMSLLPYEEVPMWVREDFKKHVIIIGDYHIHLNNLPKSFYGVDMGKFLVFNGKEELLHSSDTLEEAKAWATEEARLDKEDSQDYEMVSDCCGAAKGEYTDICPECNEHCSWEKSYFAEGGVTEAVKFKVVYKIKDAEPKEKVFDNAEKAEFFLETIKEDDDIESANLVEVKPEKKAKPTNLFAAAKPATTTAASKKGKEDVFVSGIADEIARYDALKAIIKNAESEQSLIGDRLKEVGVDKFLELYELRRRNPDTFNLADEDKKIMFIVMDKYKKVEPEKAAMLENYSGLLETITTYKFNPELLDRTGEIVSRLIMESSELTDEEKANLIIAETKMQIQKGAIDRLLDYDNPAQIFTLIEPILALK